MKTVNEASSWGYGAAKLASKSTKEETERVVFVPDTHFPYQHDEHLASALRFIRRVKPHRVVHLGDLLDFHSLSRFNQEQERLDELQNEVDEANVFLRALRNAAPDAKIDLIQGNHDIRLARYVAENARALTSLRALEFKRLLHVQENGIRLHEPHGLLLRKNFLATHGVKVTKTAAKLNAQSMGVNGISAHTHRLSRYRQNGYQPLEWVEAGTLSRLDPPYVIGVPDWQAGMAIGHFSTKTDSFVVDLIQVMDGKFLYGGKSY